MTLIELAKEYYDYVSDPRIIGYPSVEIHKRIAQYHLDYAKILHDQYHAKH